MEEAGCLPVVAEVALTVLQHKPQKRAHFSLNAKIEICMESEYFRECQLVYPRMR